jgi:hypothetical protein
MVPTITAPRTSSRTRAPRDFLKPTHKGKVYSVLNQRSLSGKQRVPVTLTYPGKQRMSGPEHKCARIRFSSDEQLPFCTTTTYKEMYDKFRATIRDKRNNRVGWSDIFAGLSPYEVQQMFVFRIGVKRRRTCKASAHSVFDQPMPKPDLPPVLKFRTRATIGGDQVDYPYSTTAVTANLECIKILLNAMISDDINLSTIDLEDFYLGTNLPQPEYVRIPTKFLPKKVIDFYKLKLYLHNGALYCAVLKTHYGLPQAGALSQERLFAHLLQHGYTQLSLSQSLFRNEDGSIRFSLVVDDFAVIWSKKASMEHLIQTLRKLYTVKVSWEGSKYLGMNITMDRIKRNVMLSMPGYVDKLLHKLRPLGVKPVTTPAIYTAPNYKSPKAQTATVDTSPLATPEQKRELQVIIGTLLYYARTVDPSILTAVHELGSVQSSPTMHDRLKAERLLRYLSVNQNGATRFYASNMQLQVQSDASYLCRPKARSVLGGFHYLGFPDRINGPIFCTNKIISCVVLVALVAETELGAAFQNAQKAAEFRNTLLELGYPQLPTPIMIDNTVAVGLAADTINAKRSKSMDVRFFWLRDRIKKGQFRVQHLAGKFNISDFFTKSLPKDKFNQFYEYVVINLDREPTVQHKRPKTETMAKQPL